MSCNATLCNTIQYSCSQKSWLFTSHNCQLVISEIPVHFLVKHPIVQTKASIHVAFNLPISGASFVNSSNRSTNWSTIASLGTAKTFPAIGIQLIRKYTINICQFWSTSVNWQLVSITSSQLPLTWKWSKHHVQSAWKASWITHNYHSESVDQIHMALISSDSLSSNFSGSWVASWRKLRKSSWPRVPTPHLHPCKSSDK